MHCGVTATRQGITPKQLAWAERVLLRFWDLGCYRLHHGDCVGGDEQLHHLAYGLGFWIIIHPPINPRHRAWCGYTKGRYGLYERVTVLPAKDYIPRNHDIVDASDYMLAAPKERDEQWRGSGTWATIRYTLKSRKPLEVVYP